VHHTAGSQAGTGHKRLRPARLRSLVLGALLVALVSMVALAPSQCQCRVVRDFGLGSRKIVVVGVAGD
jgi:hypothetical protein